MKTVVLAHADVDGMCSASIVKAAYPDAQVFFTKPVSLLVDLKHIKADKLIIADIAINKKDALDIVKFLNSKDVLYFDHHIIPVSINKEDIKCDFVHSTKASASELVYTYFQKELQKEMAWPAVYGVIADFLDNTDFVKTVLRDWDSRALYFEASVLVMGIKEDTFDNYNSKRGIVDYLASGKQPSGIPKLVEAARNAINREFRLYKLIKNKAKTFGNIGYVDNIPGFGFRGPAALFAATATDKPVGFCVFKKENHIDITIRSRDGIPLNMIADKAAESVGGSGGGHPTASGSRIPLGSFDKFLEKADELISQYINS